MTKKMLHQEWAVDLDKAIEMEAERQAVCMQTRTSCRAYEASQRRRSRCSRATDGQVRTLGGLSSSAATRARAQGRALGRGESRLRARR